MNRSLQLLFNYGNLCLRVFKDDSICLSVMKISKHFFRPFMDSFIKNIRDNLVNLSVMTKNICFLILLYMLLVPVKVFACGNAYFTPDMPISGSKLELKKILTPKGDMLYPYWSQAKGDNLYERRDSLYDVIFNPKKVGRRREADWYNIEVALDNNVDFRLLSDFAWYELKLYDK